MSPPPLHTQLHTSLPSYGSKKRVRRVLVQCDACAVVGSARVEQRGQRWWVVNTELPSTLGGDRQHRHRDCGGMLVGFDISEAMA